MEDCTLVQVLEGHTDRVWSVEWSPAGDMLATCSGDKTVRIWARQARSETWVCTAILEETHHRTIRSCSWSPDGRNLATASFDATTAIWEVQGDTWEQVALLEGHESEVKGVAWSPSGTLLATCSRDKTVWVWEAEPGHEYECVDVKTGHTQDVKSVRWHPSGEVLVSTSYDDSIKLWVDGNDEWYCAQTLSGPGMGHTSTVWAVAFNADGTRMVSCSDDATLRIWECSFVKGFREPKWRLLATLSGYHERTIFSVDWSASGLIATGCGNNGVRVFKECEQQTSHLEPSGAPSFELVCQNLQAHSSDVNCVRWHPQEASLLASASDDGTVKLWTIGFSQNGHQVAAP